MDTTFYNSIFPSVGLRVLAVFKQGLKSPPSHSFYDSNDDLIEAASTYNTLGKNVYHGCAVYKSSDSRKGDNVLAIKSLWLDLDVGDTKPYATKQDAAAHLEQFRITLGLPLTHMVSSGGGIHSSGSWSAPATGADRPLRAVPPGKKPMAFPSLTTSLYTWVLDSPEQ